MSRKIKFKMSETNHNLVDFCFDTDSYDIAVEAEEWCTKQNLPAILLDYSKIYKSRETAFSVFGYNLNSDQKLLFKLTYG